MRLQLTALLAIAAASTLPSAPAHADGTLMTRGAYYKERSTRVIQPMLDGMFDVGTRGILDAHLLVDAITSASAGSGAADNKSFTEKRYEAGARYTHELDGPRDSFVDLFRVSGEGKFSTESDYRSIYVGGRGEAELAQKNAVVGAGAGVSFDSIDNAGAQSPLGGPKLKCEGDASAVSSSCPLRSYLGSLSASQIVSPNALVAVTYDINSMKGFQSNAYRQVVTSGGFFAESHPFSRLRQAVAVSGRYYYPTSETTFIAAYRYYHDDWHITAHTPELRIVQQVGITADATLRYRYYTQTAAFFAPSAYNGRYPDPTMSSVPYLTDDPKMTAYDGHIIEAKLGLLGSTFPITNRTWARARFEGTLEYVVQHNRFGNAIEAHVAVSLPIDY